MIRCFQDRGGLHIECENPIDLKNNKILSSYQLPHQQQGKTPVSF